MTLPIPFSPSPPCGPLRRLGAPRRPFGDGSSGARRRPFSPNLRCPIK